MFLRRPEGSLTTTLKVTCESLDHESIRPVEDPTRIAMSKVATPSRQIAADASHQVVDRNETPPAGRQFTQTIPKPSQRTL